MFWYGNVFQNVAGKISDIYSGLNFGTNSGVCISYELLYM